MLPLRGFEFNHLRMLLGSILFPHSGLRFPCQDTELTLLRNFTDDVFPLSRVKNWVPNWYTLRILEVGMRLQFAWGLLCASIPLLAQSGSAHPGGTDANGCHTNKQTGDYHCHTSSQQQLLQTAQVISTGDGDTLRVRSGTTNLTVRIGCVDAPEILQLPWGSQSAARLKQLLPPGQAVQFRKIDQDRYGRTVAEVFANGQSIGLKMVREGQALVYPAYINNCSATKNAYLQAQAQAKQQGLGVWNPANPLKISPWDYRK